jgi:hypothetical protein
MELVRTAHTTEGDATEAARETRRPAGLSLDAVWAILAVALPAAASMLGRMVAIDLAYQVRAGNVMLDTHHVLRVNTFTFVRGGVPWLNQQWGAQVVTAIAWRLGGWNTVAFAWGLLIGATFFFVYRSVRACGASARTASLLTLGSYVVGIELLAMRPQLFGIALFAATQWIVSTRAEQPRRLWLIPILMVVWANTHGSFPLAFLVLGFAWLRDRRSNPALARTTLGVAAASLATSLVNPYGPRVWSYVAGLSTNGTISKYVAEWMPPSVRSPTGLLFFGSLLAVAAFFARRREAVDWITLLELAVVAGLGFLAIRGVIWWALVAPVTVARVMGTERRRERSTSPLNAVLAAAVVLLVLVALPFRRGTNPETGAPDVLTVAPQELVAAAVARVPAGSNVFASQVFASWMEFSAPSDRVLVDSRIELFPDAVWQQYLAVSDGREGWQATLDVWNVRALVLDPGQASGLLKVIGSDGGWRRVLRTDDGSVYVRS